jgi:hypothetical protein
VGTFLIEIRKVDKARNSQHRSKIESFPSRIEEQISRSSRRWILTGWIETAMLPDVAPVLPGEVRCVRMICGPFSVKISSRFCTN